MTDDSEALKLRKQEKRRERRRKIDLWRPPEDTEWPPANVLYMNDHNRKAMRVQLRLRPSALC